MTQIIFLPHEEICPEGAVIDVEPGMTICDAALKHGIEIAVRRHRHRPRFALHGSVNQARLVAGRVIDEPAQISSPQGIGQRRREPRLREEIGEVDENRHLLGHPGHLAEAAHAVRRGPERRGGVAHPPAVVRQPRHELWLADHTFLDVDPQLVQGPSQVTDAWLAELARRQGGSLASLDGGLVSLHPDVSELIV